MGIVLILLFTILLFLGVPIAISMGFSAIVSLILFNGPSALAIVHKIITGVDSYILIAIPFFILAGEIMNTGGITNRIFNFANMLVGRIPGGMGHSNVVASIIFSGMSGSAVADTGGLGMIEMKAMKDQGFDDEFSAAVTCASATIGPIIPPSIPLVVFGAMAEVSVGSLFIAGIVPGLLMGLTTIVLVYIISIRRKYPIREKMEGSLIVDTVRRALLPLLTPVIVIGGILTGIVTPTEAAVIASVYAILLSIIYREMTLKKFRKILLNTVVNSATIIFIIAAATAFAWILAIEGIPRDVTAYILSVSENPVVILLLLNIALLIMGMFMEGLSILTIVVPFLMPIMQTIGLDPVHLGIMVVLNLMIGLTTPPVGMSLFVMNKIARVDIRKLYKEILPFLIPLLLVLFCITYMPNLVLFLPNLIMN